MPTSSTSKQKPKRNWKQTGELIQVGLGFFAIIITVISFIADATSLKDLLSITQTNEGGIATKAQVESINAEIRAIKQEQENLNSKIESLSQPTTDTALASELVNVKSSVESIDTRLNNIESLIIQDPQKALEIPLLRKDIDNLITTNEIQIAALRQDAERSFNLMLVTIVALAVAIMAPALGNIFKRDMDEKGNNLQK